MPTNSLTLIIKKNTSSTKQQIQDISFIYRRHYRIYLLCWKKYRQKQSSSGDRLQNRREFREENRREFFMTIVTKIVPWRSALRNSLQDFDAIERYLHPKCQPVLFQKRRKLIYFHHFQVFTRCRFQSVPVRVQFSTSIVFKMCRHKMCRFRVNRGPIRHIFHRFQNVPVSCERGLWQLLVISTRISLRCPIRNSAMRPYYEVSGNKQCALIFKMSGCPGVPSGVLYRFANSWGFRISY